MNDLPSSHNGLGVPNTLFSVVKEFVGKIGKRQLVNGNIRTKMEMTKSQRKGER
jgi:hypothetical protein